MPAQGKIHEPHCTAGFRRESGAILLSLIVTLTIIAVLGSAMILLVSSSTYTQLRHNDSNRAFYLAEGGTRYAELEHPPDGTTTYTLTNGDQFVLTVTDETELTARGIVNPGTGAEAVRMIITEISPADPPAPPPVAQNAAHGNEVKSKKNTTIEGNIASKTKAKVSGTVTGDVHAEDEVKVAKNGIVGGDIFSDDKVEVDGDVGGEIHADGDIKLKKKATVGGDIFSNGKIKIEGTVNGDIHAGGDVKIEKDAVINGSIFSDGKIEIKGTVNGDLHSGSEIKVDSKGTVDGDAVTSGTVDNKGTITGTVTEGAGTPPLITPVSPEAADVPDSPPLTTFSVGGTDYDEGNGSIVTLAPGSYGELKLANNCQLHLSGGDYYFEKLTIGEGADIHLDLSGADISIFVEEDAKIDKNSEVYVNGTICESADQEQAGKVYLETHKQWELGDSGDWFGTVYAKEEAEFKRNCNVYGMGFSQSQKVELRRDTTLVYVPSNYASANW